MFKCLYVNFHYFCHFRRLLHMYVCVYITYKHTCICKQGDAFVNLAIEVWTKHHSLLIPNFTVVVLEQISFMSVIVYFVVCAYLDSLHSHMCECTYMWVSAVTPVHCQRTDNVQQHLKIMACNGKWLNATFCICSVTRTDINSVLLEQYAHVCMCGCVDMYTSHFQCSLHSYATWTDWLTYELLSNSFVSCSIW